MPKNKCSNCQKPCQCPKLEDKLLHWIEEQQQSGYIVTRNMIIIKTKAMAAELQITGFLVSNSWCMKFLWRKNLALLQKRRLPKSLQKICALMITNFHSFIIKRRRKENYELVLIRNMDKFLFGLTCHLLELWIRKARKLSRSTQLVMRNGSLLSPLHVWQTEQSWSPWWTSKTLPKENFPPGVLVHCHLKVWMDEAGMKLWVDSMAVMTHQSSEKERSPCLGLLSRSSCQLSEASGMPNKHRHRCNTRWFNQHSSTTRHFPKQT